MSSKHASDGGNNAVSASGGGGAAYHAAANRRIVERRIEVSRKKREARQKALDADRERNLRLRTLFTEAHDGAKEKDGSGMTTIPPPMFAVKVVACPTLRSELKMNGREKRGRMFVERPPSSSSSSSSRLGDNDGNDDGYDYERQVGEWQGDDADAAEHACKSLGALRRTVHQFFRRLRKSTYVLSASLPTLDEGGNVLTHAYDGKDAPGEEDATGTWPLESDDDVRRAFVEAEEFYLHHLGQQNDATSAMKRPTLVLHVTKDPNAPPLPPPPPYLIDMPDPKASDTMTMLSFYSFPPDGGIPDPESTADILRKSWRPFGALGRVYVAREGVNAQMAVPTNVLSNFLDCCTLSDEEGGALSGVLGKYMENGMNIDPTPLGMREFFRDDGDPPFRNLHVRVRSQIVADGLERPLDWERAGYDMPPLEWHAKLKEARENANAEGGDEDSKPIVFDCRNDYETQVGKFELAEPLNTTNFRDSWDVLRDRLRDVPKDAPIMTYCTGGIRCVKVNAYLTQELEFTNVSRLAGGVVAYDRTLNERAPEEEPMFKGVNYVFDGRMGRRITDDQIGTCHTCGRKTHLVTNCKNGNCNKRMVQCEYCSESLFGTCSEGCKKRVVTLAGKSVLAPAPGGEEKKEELISAEWNDEEVYATRDDYASAHSTDPPPLLREIELNTQIFLPTGAHMVSGSAQGRLLSTLASQSREGRVLEIGTFTGYATACFLEGAAAAGRCTGAEGIGGRDGGPFVLSLERDRRALGVAAAHLRVMADHGVGDDGAREATELRSRDGSEDFEGDSALFAYDCVAGCELLRVSDALATIEEMASENPPHPCAPFDIVFVDADKTRLMEYVDALAGNDRALKRGGLIVVDNVLWKGLVLDASRNGKYDDSDDSDGDEQSREERELLRRNRRARKLASKMHRFNRAVVMDGRVEVLMMNLRDGLSVIRKRC